MPSKLTDAWTHASARRSCAPGNPSASPPLELQLDVYPLTRTPRPERVIAWVRYPAAALQVEAEVVAWTPRAVAIRWPGPDGVEQKVWVWASAVDRE